MRRHGTISVQVAAGQVLEVGTKVVATCEAIVMAQHHQMAKVQLRAWVTCLKRRHPYQTNMAPKARTTSHKLVAKETAAAVVKAQKQALAMPVLYHKAEAGLSRTARLVKS